MFVNGRELINFSRFVFYDFLTNDFIVNSGIRSSHTSYRKTNWEESLLRQHRPTMSLITEYKTKSKGVKIDSYCSFLLNSHNKISNDDNQSKILC